MKKLMKGAVVVILVAATGYSVYLSQAKKNNVSFGFG